VDDAIRLVSEENKDDPITENKQHPVKEELQPWLLLLTTTNQVSLIVLYSKAMYSLSEAYFGKMQLSALN